MDIMRSYTVHNFKASDEKKINRYATLFCYCRTKS